MLMSSSSRFRPLLCEIRTCTRSRSPSRSRLPSECWGRVLGGRDMLRRGAGGDGGEGGEGARDIPGHYGGAGGGEDLKVRERQ